METISLTSGQREVVCSNPVYYARLDDKDADHLVPSHLIAWPTAGQELDEVCYVRLKKGQVPVLVAPQPDGSVWLGGAYLDRIAAELMLIPRPLPHEMKEKTMEWLKAVGERWQTPDKSRSLLK